MQTAVPLARLGAAELASSIAAGDVSARESVEVCLERIEEVDGRLNALVWPRFEEARREADEADAARRRGDALGPLHGVPVTVKDQFDVAGLPTTFGVTRLAQPPADADGRMVAALRAAGAIVLGKTNVPQTLGAIETGNAMFGRTNNPWDLSRTPGGSSGADGALVAAGAIPLSLGADYGGSLRIPAAWNGVCTLKPTARRLPTDRAPIRSAGGEEGIIAQPGPLARTTADVLLALRVLIDAIVARSSGSNPPVPWREPPASGVAGLRVALLTEVDGFTPSPAIRRALQEAATGLRSAGATVEPWDRAPDTAEGVRLALQAYMADGGAFTRQLLAGDTPHPLIKGDLQVASLPNPAIRALATALRATGQHRTARIVRHLRSLSAREYLDVLGDRIAYEQTFIAAMDTGGYDLVLCPSTPLPAVPHGHTAKLPDLLGPSVLFNLLGMPAGVVPVSVVRPGETSDRPASRDGAIRAACTAERDSTGLPVGVQIASRHWREDLVLAAMAAIEAEVSNHPDHPGLPPRYVDDLGPSGQEPVSQPRTSSRRRSRLTPFTALTHTTALGSRSHPAANSLRRR
jgi:fatty acid amide hydrolase